MAVHRHDCLHHFLAFRYKGMGAVHPDTGEFTCPVSLLHFGDFSSCPHPHRKTQLSKLNPLQRLVYLGLMLFIIPTIVITGLLYMYYRYPFRGEMFALPIEGLHTVAILHTTGALLLVAFLVVHIYLITTGETPTSNLKAMITGYEDLEDESDSAESTPSTVVESQEQGA